MKRILAIVLLTAGCAASSGEVAGGGHSTAGSGDIEPGTLTAGAWDDNANFDFYLRYLDSRASLRGAPLVPRADRLTITVADPAGRPAAGATVRVTAGDQIFFEGPTGADGGITGTTSARAGDAAALVPMSGPAAGPPGALDVAFLVDTTGSMGDEIAYLQVEIDAIAQSLATRFPGASVRWGLVLYRDDGDDYVVRSLDFTSSIAEFRSRLGAQKASGGGDYPEALDRGLDGATELGWRPGNVARVLFHVADAPHHVGREAAVLDAVRRARARGVHVYPIAASGADELTEYTMRTEAQLTGGRYLFLTDDSGVGNEHKQPIIPCYFVTRLNAAIVRMVSMEMTGQRIEPTAGEILRSAGSPTAGICTLTDGTQLTAL